MRIFMSLVASVFFLGIGIQPAWSDSSMTVPMKNTGGDKVGEAKLTQTPHGVLIQLELSKIPAGIRAFHIHEVGECEPPFESAGAHFNPSDKKHGFLDQKGRHAGDLPNIHVPEGGELVVEVLAPQVTLQNGKNSLFDADGSALVIHEKADDYQSDPAGDAGSRIACGVISKSSSASSS
jgi:Cu-Zn family superoxide dismutase